MNINVGDIVQHRLYPSDALNPYYYVVRIEYPHYYPVLHIKRLDEADPAIYCASLVNQELFNRWKKVE